MSFSQSLLGGLRFTQAMNDLYKDHKLRSGLEEVNSEKVEEVKTKRAATAAEKAKLVDPNTEQNRMLAEQQAEFGAYQPEAYVPKDPQVTNVSGYKYRDRVTPYRPDAGLMRADQAMRRADVHEKYGADPERAVFLRRGAEQDRATAIETMTAEAFKSGSLDRLNEAYSQVNDGVASGVERGPNGEVSIYTWPDNDPTKRSLLMSAPSERDALAQLQRQIDPETFVRLANAEQNLQQGQLGMENTRQLMGERGLDRQDADYRRQYQAADDRLKYAIASRDPAEIESAYAEWDAVRRGGLAGGGTPAGLGGGGESVLNSLIKTESGGRWDAVGPKTRSGEHAVGRLQFMPSRLAEAEKALGVKIDPQDFLRNPELQQRVEQWHLSDLDRQIAAAGLYELSGKNIGGYDITPNGLIASAHLGGFKGLQKFIASKGDHNPDDGRTRIGDYMSYHAGGVRGASSGAPSGPSSGGLAKGLAQIGLKPTTADTPKLASFDPAKVYNASEEWAMANKPAGATPSDVAAMAKQRYREIEALYSKRRQGLGGAPGQPQENPEDAAAARVAKAKTGEALGSLAGAKEAGVKRAADTAAKQGQQAAMAELRKVTHGIDSLGNAPESPTRRKIAEANLARLKAAYPALSAEGKKEVESLAMSIYALYPDLD